MCRPLQVQCGCSPTTHHVWIMSAHKKATHTLKLPKYTVPCQEPGSANCKAGHGRSVKFQNPTTECAGVNAGFDPKTEGAHFLCEEALEKYGKAVYEANVKNFQKHVNEYKKKKGGFFSGWFGY